MLESLRQMSKPLCQVTATTETFIHRSKLTVTHPFTEVFGSFLNHFFEKILCMWHGGDVRVYAGVCVSINMKTEGLTVVP